MSDWLIWFGIYLLTGIVLVLIVRFVAGWQRRRSTKDSKLSADLLAIAKSLEPEKGIKDRILEIIAAGLILLVWPVMPIALGIDEYLKKRRAQQQGENKLNSYDFDEKPEGEGKTTLENGCWPEHLLEVVDINTIPERHMVYDPLNRVPALPFGFLNAAWNDFVSKLRPDDEVHRFLVRRDQPYGDYGFRADEDIHGYAIKRDGIVVEQFVYESD
jgi:hypothetical protein